MYHFSELEDKSLESMQAKLPEILETIQTENKAFAESCRQLENDNKSDELEKVKAKRT